MIKNNSCIVFLLTFLISPIWLCVSLESLNSSEINKIEKKFIKGLIKKDYIFEPNEGAYFSYDVSDYNETKMIFTIHSSISVGIDIQCMQLKSFELEDLKREFARRINNCTSFTTGNNGVINVIMNISDTKENPFLYFYLYNPFEKLENNFSIFIREDIGYRRELKTEEIKNPAAYAVYEIDPLEYYNKINETDFLLAATREEFLIYRIRTTNWYYFVDIEPYYITHFLPFSQQSLANQFQHVFYTIKSILIFVGVKDYLEDDNITLNFQPMDKTSKLYLYMFQGKEQYINFYYNCVDDKTKHYLFVDYGELDNQTKYYYRFHELIGSKAKIADIQLENIDFRNYSYKDLKKFEYFSQGKYHMHILELQCQGDKNKILSNIMINQKRNEQQTVKFYYDDNIIDFPFTFGEKNFTISYHNYYEDKLAIEICIPNEEKTKNFKITYNNNVYDIMNDEICVFNITDNKEVSNFTIQSKEKIEAFVIVTKIIDKFQIIKGNNKYLSVFYGKTNYESETFLYFYEVEHEFNTNYYIDLEFSNDYKKNFVIRFLIFQYHHVILKIVL